MRLLRGGLLNMVMALHRCKHDMLSRRGSSKKWRTSVSVDRRKLGTPMEFYLFSFSKEWGIFDRGFWGIWYTIPLCIIFARIGKGDGITLALILSRFIFLFLSYRHWCNVIACFRFRRNEKYFEIFFGKLGDTDSLCSSVCREFFRGWKKDESTLSIFNTCFNFCTFLFLFLYSLFLSFYCFFHTVCVVIVESFDEITF